MSAHTSREQHRLSFHVQLHVEASRFLFVATEKTNIVYNNNNIIINNSSFLLYKAIAK